MFTFALLALMAAGLGCCSARYECDPSVDVPVSEKFGIGTNFGGWLVLEPWITPSLFYQFLGATEKYGVHGAKDHTGMDSYSFCTALGPKEANRQLRRHWDSWLTEGHVRRLYEAGVHHIRIPVADWMFVPYEPYAGCFDGALEQLDRALGLLHKYNMTGLLDVHCVKNSANGLDNGGQSMGVQWYEQPDEHGTAHFDHYKFKSADWIGLYNVSTETYGPVNNTNLNHTLRVFEVMIDMYKDSSAVFGLEAVNEPWTHTPMDALKAFYWEAYQLVQARAPHWLFVMHDSFNATVANWGGFMEGCPNVALDSHIYQAWNGPDPIESFVEGTCNDGVRLNRLREAGLTFIVGEWSLATDNCAMWLNGFNDNLPGYPMVDCMYVPCAEPYMGEQPGAPPPRDGGVMNDPHGTGASFVVNGSCPIGRPFPDEDAAMRSLLRAKMFAYHFTHGHFYWNFRTEIDYRWSFEELLNRGWLLPEEIKNYNRRAEAEHLNTGCSAYLPAVSLISMSAPAPPTAGPPASIHGDAKPYSPSWFERLLVWLLLCGAFYVAITLLRRVCRSCTGQPYTTIEDEEADTLL